ncbi:MAG: DoxX family protein [Bacteroidales bacterium]|nr:DoxX family protein [Bacteroidales bacterium]
MKLLAQISRYLLGAVFLFSGIVKAVDPLGSTYKFIDYFNAFGFSWAAPLALALAFVLSGAEFLTGLALLFNLKTKLFSWFALIFMAIFTPLTLFIALKNPVSDCGCFGDALIMTNWETFFKNIILITAAIIIFLYREKFVNKINSISQMRSIGIFILIIFFFQLFNLKHLPIIDFRPYKVGSYIPDQMIIPENAPKEKSIYNYPMKNIETGEITTITSDDYLNDVKWQNPETYEIIADQIEGPIIIEKGYLPPIHDFTIEPIEQFNDEYIVFDSDITPQILADERYIMLCVAYDLEQTNDKALEMAEEIYQYFKTQNYPFFMLTGSGSDEALKLKHDLKLNFIFTNTDPITLKTIVRANPGFVLLKEGKIIEKWHYNDLPNLEYFKKLNKQK